MALICWYLMVAKDTDSCVMLACVVFVFPGKTIGKTIRTTIFLGKTTVFPGQTLDFLDKTIGFLGKTKVFLSKL